MTPAANEPYRNARALVLGASGFIGTWVVRALHARGAEVHAAVRPGSLAAARTRAGRLAHIVEADLAVSGAVSRVVGAVRPAIVFNLAGYGVDPGETDAGMMKTVNADVVRELCECLAGTPGGAWPGARLVHAGSALEYGPLAGLLDEAREPAPTTAYGRTKLLGTELVAGSAAAAGLRAVVARLFTVYGPGEHPARLLPSLFRVARDGGRLALTAGDQRRDFTYAGDVAEGLLRIGLCPAPPGAVLHLATGRLTLVRTFAETAAAVIGLDPHALDFGALPPRAGEMWHDEVDVTRLRGLTSWTPPTGIAEGIRLSWERAHAERDDP